MAKGTTRNRIVEAATALMLERGYAATTVDDIVTTAGVAKGSFYHFFESKEALGLAALDAYMQRGSAVVAGGSFGAVKDPVERALAFVDHVEAVSGELWEHGCLAGSFAVELGAASPAIREAIATWFTRLEAMVARILAPVSEASRVKDPPTADELAAQLLTVIEGAIVMGRARSDVSRLGQAVQEFGRYLRTLLR